jgi:hypothetical protein
VWQPLCYRLRNDEERGMTCEMCCRLSDVNIQHWQQGSSKKNLFVVGSKNYKLSTIIDHERSNMHVRVWQRVNLSFNPRLRIRMKLYWPCGHLVKMSVGMRYITSGVILHLVYITFLYFS